MRNSNESSGNEQPSGMKNFFMRQPVIAKFNEILGKRSTAFITSVLQIVATNDKLEKADPTSVYNAACVAAVLNLPLNPNLGFAYIVPYNIKQKDANGKEYWKTVAQFQLGYKGYIQLCQRSKQFKTINVSDVRETEMKIRDRLSGEIGFEWINNDDMRQKQPVIGYVGYFRLLNGFEKLLYMSATQLNFHGAKYSKTFEKNGLWKTDFDAMASKTVLKLLLSRYAPLSVDMELAITADQALINDEQGSDVTYVDHDPEEMQEIFSLWSASLGECKTLEEVNHLELQNAEAISAEPMIQELFIKYKQSLSKSPAERSKLLMQQTQMMLDEKANKTRK